MTKARTLYLIGTAAPPVLQLHQACQIAIDLGWDPCVILSPTAAGWVDVDRLADVTAKPVRVHPRQPSEQDPLPPADAVLAAPLTFNTINKWAAGISDNLALGILNELLVDGPVIAAAHCAKASLRLHPAFAASIDLLSMAGVDFIDQNQETLRRGDGFMGFDWEAALKSVDSPGFRRI